MRIAVPSVDDRGLDSEVAAHFGRAPYYTIIDVEGGKIIGVEVVKQPFSQHGPGDVPNFLKSLGVDVVLAYGMGPRAQGFFSSLGIKTVTGAYGRIRDVIRGFLSGNLPLDHGWRTSGEFGLHRHDL